VVMDAKFESVYEAHFRDVRRFVFRFVQDPSAADELADDAFLKAYEAWNGFRGDAPELIWLLRIARNVCLDYVRSPRARTRALTSLDEVRERAGGETTALDGLAPVGKEPLPDVEATARRAEMTECVQQFVLSLPETLRTPLILHDIEGFTNAEIAQILDCSVPAAKMRLHRARERLREMMEKRCDIFHDERNVLSCLPGEADLIDGRRAFVPLAAVEAT